MDLQDVDNFSNKDEESSSSTNSIFQERLNALLEIISIQDDQIEAILVNKGANSELIHR